MSMLVEQLRPKERRGSKARCHLLTHGAPDEVAARLTAMVAPFARVAPDDCWMPNGFLDLEEAQLNKATRLLETRIATQLGAWWLPVDRSHATTPNFDIASTCSIGGVPGLLLVEAKAHDEELRKEEAGRKLREDKDKDNDDRGKRRSDDREASHGTIGAAIESAALGIGQATSRPCTISRDSHYQMSNRFAWAWKLTDLGIPVVLVYLGFLNADEMRDRGVPLTNHENWAQLVNTHSAPLFPADLWNRAWVCNGRSLIPLIRSLDVSLTDVDSA